MRILAIETSCDETGIALVEGTYEGGSYTFITLKAALLSQALLHAPYGGVYPNLAKREHEKNLPALFEQFRDEAYDAIAVTAGPGLEPALWQGIEFAKKIAAEKNLPLIPVNHMEGHLISSLGRRENTTSQDPNDKQIFKLEHINLPVLALLISGGHTEFVLMREWFRYELIGQTLDDAVGECFDKVARMLGLPYPGGPEISKIAAQWRSENSPDKGPRISRLAPPSSRSSSGPDHLSGEFSFRLPRPMIQSGTCDVSFSGLKTAALYSLKNKNLNEEEKSAFAAEFEDTVADVFVAKTRAALEQTGAKTFVIGGGVAANTYIRERLELLTTNEFPGIEFRIPHLGITGDNAVMIAHAALARRLSGRNDATATENIRAIGNLALTS